MTKHKTVSHKAEIKSVSLKAQQTRKKIIEAGLRIEAAPEDIAAADKILWMCEKNIDFFLNHPDYAKCFLLFYYYASIDEKLRALNEILDKCTISRLETYFEFALNESVSAEHLRHAAISVHSQIVCAVIRFYTVPQTVSKEEFRADFLSRCQYLVGKLA